MGLGTAQYCVHIHLCLIATFSTLLGRKFQNINKIQTHMAKKLTGIFLVIYHMI